MSRLLSQLKADHASRQPDFWSEVWTGAFAGYVGPHNTNTQPVWSGIHLVHRGETDTPICGYKPSPKLTFQMNASGVYLPYVSCPKCRNLYAAGHPQEPTVASPGCAGLNVTPEAHS